jgi:hypothetical protein
VGLHSACLLARLMLSSRQTASIHMYNHPFCFGCQDLAVHMGMRLLPWF